MKPLFDGILAIDAKFYFDSGTDSRLLLRWREPVEQFWNAMETLKQERK